jgi:hypothetical protein
VRSLDGAGVSFATYNDWGLETGPEGGRDRGGDVPGRKAFVSWGSRADTGCAAGDFDFLNDGAGMCSNVLLAMTGTGCVCPAGKTQAPGSVDSAGAVLKSAAGEG